jgi:hypothetical protein
VLGPPRNEAALNDLGEHGSAELYGIAAGLGAGARLRVGAENPQPRGPAVSTLADSANLETTVPFDSRFQHPRESPLIQRLLQKTYFAAEDAWRSVDEDWLHVATDLALQLDSSTNNSSLALAFERISDGKVLLFPGDAQQGNWLSWFAPAMKWTVPASGTVPSAVSHATTGPSATGHSVTAADLLERTVFYKVGHHASHNATAKSQGLEQMKQQRELTAFIPVDRAVALTRNPKGSWKMPARPLYRRLLEQCNGRVVRSDVGWADESTLAVNKPVEQEFDGLATAAEWTTWKKAQRAATHVQITRLFAEFILT